MNGDGKRKFRRKKEGVYERSVTFGETPLSNSRKKGRDGGKGGHLKKKKSATK